MAAATVTPLLPVVGLGAGGGWWEAESQTCCQRLRNEAGGQALWHGWGGKGLWPRAETAGLSPPKPRCSPPCFRTRRYGVACPCAAPWMPSRVPEPGKTWEQEDSPPPPRTALSMAPPQPSFQGQGPVPPGRGLVGRALLRSLVQGSLSAGSRPCASAAQGLCQGSSLGWGLGGWGRPPGQGRDGARAWSPHMCHWFPSG